MNAVQKTVVIVALSVFVILWPQRMDKKFSALEEIVQPAVLPAAITATPSPIPTAIPTASPQALAGYCLNVPVLLYHHVQPQAQAESKGQKNISVDSTSFDAQISYLKNSGYTTISAEQLADVLLNKQKLPAKSIVLTFDDAYDDFYTYVYPIMQKNDFVANLMVPTGLVGNAGYLRWDQLKEMVSSGSVFVYNHTWSHAALTGKSIDKLSFEVLTANQQLKDHLDKNTTIFTYPYGSSSQAVIDFLQANGFIAAFSTIPGTTQCDSFIMTLHRNRVGNSPLSSYGL